MPEPERAVVDDSGELYVELHLHTCYSLLEGASDVDEHVRRAVELGYQTLAVTDRNNLYGAMVFAQRCRAAGLRAIIGVELTIATDSDDRHDLTLLAATRDGYANLSRLVSMANGWGLDRQADRERRRKDPHVTLDQLQAHTAGVICLTGGRHSELTERLDADDRHGATAVLQRWLEWFGADNVWVELQHNLVQGDDRRIRRQVALARESGVGVVATGDVHYHQRERHRLHDALTAIRHRTTLDGCHVARRANSEFYLRSAAEQAERFAAWPDAVHNSVRIADRCTFDLLEDLGYELPTPPVPTGHTTDTWLRELCEQQLHDRYDPNALPAARARLDEELTLIARRGLSGFFLTYHEVFRLATEVATELRAGTPRARLRMAPGRGRGSSVSSIVCYLIGLSHIDPIANNLFLGRFLNESMTTLPDIDLDFPRDIRDRLFQMVYEHWGNDHAALVATFPRYRLRSAVRDLGKALGLPATEIDRLAKMSEGYSQADDVAAEMAQIPELADQLTNRSWRQLIGLARQLANFPRHVSQHVGGIIISSRPLIDCVPIQPVAWPGRYVCQWDKDDVDDAGMVKIDILALAMLSLVDDALDAIHEHRGELVDLSRIDFNDHAVYERIGRGDTVGVFQIESRAQANMLPRTKPKNLEDLTAQVAIIRPGPIVGGAIGGFLEGRQRPARGDPPRLAHPLLREALAESYGTVLYQEQVVQVAMAMGGFDAGLAERFRRAMGRKDWGPTAQDEWWGKFCAGANEQGVPDNVARRVFNALLGFAHYGFPKSHAAAFGLLAYQSAWLKEHYPAEFYTGLFNNWPMGFYPPHVFTNDAKRHGVEIQRPDINTSNQPCTVAHTHGPGAVQIGLGYIHDLGAATADAIVDERHHHGPYRSLPDFVRRTGLGGHGIENAIRIGTFDMTGLGRRELIWQLGLLRTGRAPARPQHGPRQLQLDLPTEQDHIPLTEASPYQAMADDYEILGLSPSDHPMRHLRHQLPHDVLSSRALLEHRPGRTVTTAGMVVVRQRPQTAVGTVFMLLEDEDGVCNITVTPDLYEHHRTHIRGTAFLTVTGALDNPAGNTATIQARTITPIHTGTLHTPNGKSWG